MKKLLYISAIALVSTSCVPELTYPGRITAIISMQDYCVYESQHRNPRNEKRPVYEFFTDDCNVYQIGDQVDSIGAERVSPFKKNKEAK